MIDEMSPSALQSADIANSPPAAAELDSAQPPISPGGDWFESQDDLHLPARGDVRDGIIVSAGQEGLLVDIGGKSEGLIDPRELDGMAAAERSKLAVGAQVVVYVVNTRDRDGNLILSLSRAKEELDWRWVEELLKTREGVDGTITGYNKGGLLVKLGRLSGFAPSSQLDSSRQGGHRSSSPAERWAPLIGEPIRVKVIELDRDRNRLILSERAAMKERRARERARLLEELREGQTRRGRVSNLVDFGAFVDLGGVDGLVHLSELSWKPVSHPRDVISVGDEVEVYVLNVDPEQERIGLSLKRLVPDPWLAIEEKLPVGKLIEATISNLTSFGAFARPLGLEEIEGLIHISELSEQRIAHPREVVESGQRVAVRVIGVDTQRHRLALSLNKVDSDEYLDLDWPSRAADDGWEPPRASSDWDEEDWVESRDEELE